MDIDNGPSCSVLKADERATGVMIAAIRPDDTPNDSNIAIDPVSLAVANMTVDEEKQILRPDAMPKWPIKSPPPSDVESEDDSADTSSPSTPSQASSISGDHNEAGTLILDVDRINVTFSTA